VEGLRVKVGGLRTFPANLKTVEGLTLKITPFNLDGA
jgi:hypothetical protein